MSPTSVSLLDRLRQQPHDEDWTRFVALYRPFIERFIRLEPALAADAEDVCQEVMKKLVEHLPRFHRERDGSFRAWLKTITINEVNEFWRRRQRRRSIGGDDAHSILDALGDPQDALSQQWDRDHGRHVLRRLRDLIEPEFSPTTWQAFRLRMLEEKPSAEVASLLKISTNAVNIAKSRVLARLRKEAAGFLDD